MIKLGYTYLIAIENYRFPFERGALCWFRKNKESFSKGFIFFTGLSYNGKLKEKKSE